MALPASAAWVTITGDEQSVEVTMPLAPGDRRIFQLAHVGSGYAEPAGLVVDGVLQEIWVGNEGPHVTYHPAVMEMSML